jgi:hypothetical protein
VNDCHSSTKKYGYPIKIIQLIKNSVCFKSGFVNAHSQIELGHNLSGIVRRGLVKSLRTYILGNLTVFKTHKTVASEITILSRG